MNRIIKFRAWSPQMKKILEWDIVQNMMAELLLTESEANIPLQFTGLLDRHGKEIYEGDICKNGDWEEDAHAYNYRVEEVKYNDQEASFSGWNPNEDGMTCEVIGNIYENPELLK